MTTATSDAQSASFHSAPLSTGPTRSPTFRPSRGSMSSELATSPRRSPSTSRQQQQHPYGTANGSASGSQRAPVHLPRGHDSSDVAALSSSLEDARLDALLPPPARHIRTTIETSLDKAVAAAGSSHTRPPHHGLGAARIADENMLPAFPVPQEGATTSSLIENEPMGPFEGPEKLLEVWFADAREDVEHGGLLQVDRRVWEDMLDIVKCKVLSTIRGCDADAYLLSESSMFVFPHKLILKTCGTTTLLLGLERLLSIAYSVLKPTRAADAESLTQLELGKFVKRCFYSRKSFMFPERQKGPHRDWLLEVSLLDQFFEGGAAYTVGKMNGNHWLLYMTSPAESDGNLVEATDPSLAPIERPLRVPNLSRSGPPQDETLEILMTHLSPASCSRFEFPESARTPADASVQALCKSTEKDRGHLLGAQLCETLGLAQLFDGTSLDAFAFEPCGFSANALISRSSAQQDSTVPAEDGYWTVHVTPEQDSSYASFETNACSCQGGSGQGKGLPWLIARVLSIFEPARLSVTLFTSSAEEGEDDDKDCIVNEFDDLAPAPGGKTQRVAVAQSVVKTNASTSTAGRDPGDILHALQLKGYRRTDRIAYEFEDYDLVFVSFDKIGGSLPRQ